MSAQDRYIYKVWKGPVPARCNIVFKCFSYDVFMGYIHPKQLISQVDILYFLERPTYVDVVLEVHI